MFILGVVGGNVQVISSGGGGHGAGGTTTMLTNQCSIPK